MNNFKNTNAHKFYKKKLLEKGILLFSNQVDSQQTNQ